MAGSADETATIGPVPSEASLKVLVVMEHPGIGTLMPAFSARNPHIPSMPLHCCTSVTLAPVSLMRSRLFSPTFWARRWHGV